MCTSARCCAISRAIATGMATRSTAGSTRFPHCRCSSSSSGSSSRSRSEAAPIGTHPRLLRTMTERFFAPCPRGLEQELAAELAALRANDIAPAEGGVGFAAELGVAYRANLESRIASRILWRVGGFPYRNERDLYTHVQAIDWPRH